MSIVTGPPPTGGAAAPQSAVGENTCGHCESPLAEDQEWCLECGAARTLIHRPPDWRIPLVVIGVVVLLVLAAFGIALVDLSGNANRSAQAQSAKIATPTVATRAPSAARTTPARVPTAIANWPTGLSGWTVVLGRRRDRAAADTVAERVGANGIQVGVLDTSQHPSMTPGYWVIFSGRYPDLAAADAAAARLRSHGRPTAIARRVAPPGGI